MSRASARFQTGALRPESSMNFKLSSILTMLTSLAGTTYAGSLSDLDALAQTAVKSAVTTSDTSTDSSASTASDASTSTDGTTSDASTDSSASTASDASTGTDGTASTASAG